MGLIHAFLWKAKLRQPEGEERRVDHVELDNLEVLHEGQCGERWQAGEGKGECRGHPPAEPRRPGRGDGPRHRFTRSPRERGDARTDALSQHGYGSFTTDGSPV